MRRRLIPLVLPLAILLTGAPACKRVHHPNPEATIEEESDLSSSVLMSQPRDAAQLLTGFYNLEQDAWRWTARQFSVSLAPPAPRAERPGRLEFRFTIPDIAAADLKGVHIQASVEGRSLGSFQSNQAGEQLATFDIPKELMKADALIIEFSLDKTIPHREAETRELGLIAVGFRLVAP